MRYYTRMNPDRMFPLLVILSEEEIAEIVKEKVKQAVSETFSVEEGSVVEVEPVLPGCDCYPRDTRSPLTPRAHPARPSGSSLGYWVASRRVW
ncbi:hypothetical protein J8F10_22570 [Gemmata sp. G18]|uniref:Uncharacterized protein n=1 Tax=Gemmata palustris TaxID=2822762 RepID=A0ABS5BWK3_9BACT|nr:hypothetical protein [Gemmata palustris]MBP3958050.1 hypothetical protein [Gemmata palustris]